MGLDIPNPPYTAEQYAEMDFILKRVSTEISRLRYHNDTIVAEMKNGVARIRRAIHGTTPEFLRISERYKSERRFRDKYARMILKEVERIRFSLYKIPEPQFREKAYHIFDEFAYNRLKKALSEFFIEDL